MESKLQAEIIKWLKSMDAYVIKTRPGPGVPAGCPDIVFFHKHKWGAIEVKADVKFKFQPGQELTLNRLRANNDYVWLAHPFNWPYIKTELSINFF